MSQKKIDVIYVTTSNAKREENDILAASGSLADGSRISDYFKFEIVPIGIDEPLKIDIADLVKEEVVQAYARVRVPCIVEYAGLVFEGLAPYPGGLTKPMWNALGDRFVNMAGGSISRATAQAVVAYCDGLSVRTFSGETHGTLATSPKGNRSFYWDTVFVPDQAPKATSAGLTYSEIVDRCGLEFKVLQLSQSTRAMVKFLDYVRTAPRPSLWP